MSALITIQNLHVRFASEAGPVEAVRGIGLTIPRNKTLALVGESGSGKTVLSQAILGILPNNAAITEGRILFHEPKSGAVTDLAALPQDHPKRRDLRGDRISIIFQEPMSSLSPLHTIGDQIEETLHLHREVSRAEGRRLVHDMLARVGFPDPESAPRLYPFELSGGLRQRAMIAMALICHPDLLIADEPTTALDVTVQAQILKLMRDLQRDLDMAILFITHDLGVVANMADDVAVMYHGRMMESGPLSTLLARPQHPYLKALLHAVPRLSTDRAERLTPLREIRVDGQALLHQLDPEGRINAAPAEAPILTVEGVSKTFTTKRQGLLTRERRVIRAVIDASFVVPRGSCFALVGESGSGKSTLAKIILGALTPDTGEVRFNSQAGAMNLAEMRGQALKRARTRIQYIFQDPYGSLNPRMTVRDIVAEPLLIHGIGDHQGRLDRVKALLHAVGLRDEHLMRYPHSFSGGQRQRIGIARALALGPELLLCDEPVSALDVSVQAQILNLLKDLQRELGLTYLFIAHNLAVVRYVADTVAVMCAGRIVERAPTDALFDAPQHPYTKALLQAVPEPDLTHKLDFAHLSASRASDPAAWPGAFEDGDGSGRLLEVAPKHFVRKRDGRGGSDVARAA